MTTHSEAHRFDYHISEDYGKTWMLVAVNLTEEDTVKIAAAPHGRNVVRKFVPVILTERHKIYMHKRATRI